MLDPTSGSAAVEIPNDLNDRFREFQQRTGDTTAWDDPAGVVEWWERFIRPRSQRSAPAGEAERLTVEMLDEMFEAAWYMAKAAGQRRDFELSRDASIGQIIRALRTAEAPRAGMEWRPIESAPRDGNPFLAGWAGRTWAHPASWRGERLTAAEGLDGGDEFSEMPTHWAPMLPAPPVQQEEG